MRGRWSQGGEQQVGHPELEEALSRGPDGLKLKSTYLQSLHNGERVFRGKSSLCFCFHYNLINTHTYTHMLQIITLP